jgi:hypothetical protein
VRRIGEALRKIRAAIPRQLGGTRGVNRTEKQAAPRYLRSRPRRQTKSPMRLVRARRRRANAIAHASRKANQRRAKR